jgi:hypothetical protein
MIRELAQRVRMRVSLEVLASFYTVGLIAVASEGLAVRLWCAWWATVHPEVVRLVDRRMLNERRA